MAASHSQFQRLQLGVPAGNTSECVGLSNAFVLTFLAANAEAVVRERIVQLFDGRRHATKFADRWPSRPSSVALTPLLDGMAVPIAYRKGARFGELHGRISAALAAIASGVQEGSQQSQPVYGTWAL